MTAIKSMPLFVLAAIVEIGGTWLVWQKVRRTPRLSVIALAPVESPPPSTRRPLRPNPGQPAAVFSSTACSCGEWLSTDSALTSGAPTARSPAYLESPSSRSTRTHEADTSSTPGSSVGKSRPRRPVGTVGCRTTHLFHYVRDSRPHRLLF